MHALSWLVFLSASLGHTVLMIWNIGWIHAIPIPHQIQPVLKWLHGLLVLAGTATFWWLTASPFDPLTALSSGPYILFGYMGGCAVLGLAIIPTVFWQYWQRRRPVPALVSREAQTVDVAAELGCIPAGPGLYGWTAKLPGNEVFQVELTELTLRLPRLPAAWDGLRILHLSDLHFCGLPDRRYFQYVMDRCREWEPDLLALTGDLVDSHWHHRWVLPVLGRLRWRVAAFAVLGNHDYWYDTALVRRRLKRLNIRLLSNTWEQIEVRGQPLVVIGHEGPWNHPAPDLTNLAPDVFRLCLSHTPDNIYWARRHELDLVLAGHVHGGQIQVPIIGPIHVPSLYGRRFACGLFELPPTVMHVSRGLGGQDPLRFGCKPEVTQIVLRRADDA